MYTYQFNSPLTPCRGSGREQWEIGGRFELETSPNTGVWSIRFLLCCQTPHHTPELSLLNENYRGVHATAIVYLVAPCEVSIAAWNLL